MNICIDPSCVNHKAIQRVYALHIPVEGYWTTYCEECSDYSEVRYPCETIAALEDTK